MVGTECPCDSQETNQLDPASFAKEEWTKLPQEMHSKLVGTYTNQICTSSHEEQGICYRLLKENDGLGYE